MAVWPTTLPAPSLNSLQESPPDNTIRTTMEKGVDKIRRRTTASIRPLAFTMMCTPEQIEILDSFYVEETFSGSEAFTFTHPRTGDICTARFVKPPDYSERDGVVYSAAVALEVLP